MASDSTQDVSKLIIDGDHILKIQKEAERGSSFETYLIL